MRVKYVYCLVRGPESSQRFPPGIDGMVIHAIRVGEISALVSDVHPGWGSKSIENALAHHGVVSHALGCFTAVLPCRFGTMVEDKSAVVAWLKGRYSCVEGYLDRFQGRVEVGIKAMLEGRVLEGNKPPGDPPWESRTAGTRYLCAKSAQLHEAERLTRTLQEATSPLVEAVRAERKPAGRGLVLSVCCLMERANLTPFKRAYEHWRRGYPLVKCLYTGPWPPYSFADVDLT